MSIRVAHLWRHPIKGHGRETLDRVTLQKGQTMPWDRTWAIAHEGARLDGQNWVPCANFSRIAKAPALAAIDLQLDEATETVRLTHPGLDPIELHPERNADQLVTWAQQLMPENRAASDRVVRVPGRGMTDSDFPSVSLANLASHKQVEQQLDQSLDPIRWRANIWLDGLEPWAESDWIGKTIRIGAAELEIREQITRCLATTASPETGERDADTLGALKSWGHQEFGVYATVHKTGPVAVGDMVEIV